MRGTNIGLTPLAVRKQLLVVESEINRAELGREWASLHAEACDAATELTGDASALGSLASAGAALFTTGSVLRRMVSGNRAAKGSWVRTLVNGARAGISVWLALRPRVR